MFKNYPHQSFPYPLPKIPSYLYIHFCGLVTHGRTAKFFRPAPSYGSSFIKRKKTTKKSRMSTNPYQKAYAKASFGYKNISSIGFTCKIKADILY